MKVVTFFTEKGGTGKTTFNIMLSSYLAYHRKLKVLALDCDCPAFHTFQLRERELEAYKENAKEIDKKLSQDVEIYPIVKVDDLYSNVEKVINNLFNLKKKDEYDYVIFDLPGSLANNAVNKLISANIIDEFYLLTDLDKQVIVSNIKLSQALQNLGATVQVVWNRVFAFEKADLYEANTKLLEEHYNIKVNPFRIKNSIKFRREFGFDTEFIRSTLCYPVKNLEKNNINLNNLFDNITQNGRL